MGLLIDFSDCPYSSRHGMYGGMAGDKDGIIYKGENWIIKYPKPMRVNEQLIYTTSPLSEYVGSHVFSVLGVPVHETLLGIRNGKLVVACKDFCETRGALVELRTLKNAANRELSEELHVEFSVSNTGDSVFLDELLIHFKKNPVLSVLPDVETRFWDTVIVDILIDNNDRNNENAGVLFNEKTLTYQLAPVFDNGNSFCNKATDEKIKEYLFESEKAFHDRANGSRTAYTLAGHVLSARKLLQLEYPVLRQELSVMVPRISKSMNEIMQFIESIPESECGFMIMSSERKQYYQRCIEIRLNELLRPACKCRVMDAF